MGGGSGSQKGIRRFGLHQGLRPGYISPPLGLEFGPDTSLAADKVIFLQIPPDNSSIHWDEHWRGSPGRWVRGQSLPLSYWGNARPL